MSLESDPAKKVVSGLNAFLALALAATVTVGGFGLYQVWDRALENDDLEAKIETFKARVDEIRRLNKENLELKQQRERLVRRKLDEPAVMLSIEALSRVLPDSAYLTELEIHGKETRIVGKSNDPTALITKLEDSAQFGDVHFSAPTTREQGEAVGTFTIVAQTEGGSNLEPRP
jgi:general secretion pathway protein L